jgi:hypothetical protein
MDSSLEYFAWGRPVDGFVWEDARVINDSVLMPKPLARDVEETRFLRWRDRASQVVPLPPLHKNPTLFREFASLNPTEDSFVRFANDYGWLGVSQLLEGDAEVNEQGKTVRVVRFGDPRAHGEPLWRWKAAHQALSKVSDVLQAITTDDLTTLTEWFSIRTDAALYQRETQVGGEWEWVCGAANPPLRPALWKWANGGQTELERLKRIASAWAQKRINDALGNADNSTNTSVRILLNAKGGMSLHIVPDTLLAAMWLQCARVLTENPTFKACEKCGKWFEISPEMRRKSTMYCSAKCKVAAHRARIPATCEHCGARFTISVTARSGFGYISHHDVACPTCGVSSSRLLPGEVRDVALHGKRRSSKATA